jgi:hypothetical protein
MKNRSHREIYQELVSQNNVKKLRTILKNNLADMDHELVTFDILVEEDLPYIYCTVRSEEMYCGQMIGFILDSDELEIEYSSTVYYLPAIIMRDDFVEDSGGLLKKDRILQHELLHVRDILTYLDKNPSFPENYRKYGMNGEVCIEDLPKSIDMELSKLFFLEPAASILDYNSGETYIVIPLDDNINGKLAYYECHNIDEYVGLQMKNSLDRIRRTYEIKYPDDKTVSSQIDQELNKALNKYGKDVFGKIPLQGLKDLDKRTCIPIMFAITKAMRS